MKNRLIPAAAAAAALALVLAGCSDSDEGASGDTSGSGVTGSIKASGSTAQKNAMAEWINSFQSTNSGATINYQANGSGAGIQDFINKQTAFAGSDSALKPEEKTAADARCTNGEAINIPMAGGAIALAYNVSGVDKLVLTPEVIAGIFNSSITKWNDKAIADLNPDATLPDAPIAQFHRSDESGTTANFTSYLSATAPKVWTYEVGKAWPDGTGGQGSKGSDGVASSITQTPNSIGYVELSFVQDGTLKSALVDNGAGAVEATSDNAAKAIEAATVVGTGKDLALKLDPTIAEAGTYPIVLVTYEITCSTGLAAADLAVVKPFLTYTASSAGQGILTGIGYVPVTGDLLTKVQSTVSALS